MKARYKCPLVYNKTRTSVIYPITCVVLQENQLIKIKRLHQPGVYNGGKSTSTSESIPPCSCLDNRIPLSWCNTTLDPVPLAPWVYSCGQPKSTNLVSLEGMNILAIWLQIWTQDVKIHPKTSLGSFSHEELGWPNFWTFSRGLRQVLGPPWQAPNARDDRKI